MRSAGDGCLALAAALRQEGGTLASALSPAPAPAEAAPGPAQIAAAGPRAAGHEAEYELLLEMILEGSRLHYGAGRVLDPGDPDLALLLGDRLYALGLARLAELGDLEAVAELADLISLLAQAQAAGLQELAAAVWAAGATAIGWGSTPAHREAKSLAGAAHPDAIVQLRRTASPPGS